MCERIMLPTVLFGIDILIINILSLAIIEKYTCTYVKDKWKHGINHSKTYPGISPLQEVCAHIE